MGSYKIIDQQPGQYDFTNPGNPVLGTIVTFMTSDGNSDTVFIPANRYTIANVRKAAAAKAKLVDEIGQIEGSY